MNSRPSDFLTWQVMQDYIPNDLMNRYSTLFNLYDFDDCGVIKAGDIVKILAELGKCVREADVQRAVEVLLGDTVNNSTSVDFQEFLVISSALATICVPEEEMSVIYGVFDHNKDGYITPEELKELFANLGEDINEKEIQEMIAEADQDGDGKVTYDDFLRMITNSSPKNQSEYINLQLLKDIEHSKIDACSTPSVPTEEEPIPVERSSQLIKLKSKNFIKKSIQATKSLLGKLIR